MIYAVAVVVAFVDVGVFVAAAVVVSGSGAKRQCHQKQW